MICCGAVGNGEPGAELIPTGGVPLGGQRLANLLIHDNDISFQFVTNVFQVNENGETELSTWRGWARQMPARALSFCRSRNRQDADFVATNMT